MSPLPKDSKTTFSMTKSILKNTREFHFKTWSWASEKKTQPKKYPKKHKKTPKKHPKHPDPQNFSVCTVRLQDRSFDWTPLLLHDMGYEALEILGPHWWCMEMPFWAFFGSFLLFLEFFVLILNINMRTRNISGAGPLWWLQLTCREQKKTDLKRWLTFSDAFWRYWEAPLFTIDVDLNALTLKTVLPTSQPIFDMLFWREKDL